MPVRSHRGGEPQTLLGGFGDAQDVECLEEIGVLRGEPADPSGRYWLIGPGRLSAGKFQEVHGVEELCRCKLACLEKLLLSEFSDRFEQEQARERIRRPGLPRKPVLDEGSHGFQRFEWVQIERLPERLRRFEGKSTVEDRHPAKDALLGGAQQIVAPSDGLAHRLLPWGAVAVAAGQQGERAVQPLEQGGHRQDPQAGRRQLDGERETIQPAADLGHRNGVLIGQ
jgi:hypothetical protein